MYELHATFEQGVMTLADNGGGLAPRIYRKGVDFKVFGFTDGCPECDHARRYGSGRTTTPHSEACRQVIILSRGERNIAEQY